ncbi:MAG: efflux RND transporter periplasmic adaptor subunit [Gemmatimonadota bacterium]
MQDSTEKGTTSARLLWGAGSVTVLIAGYLLLRKPAAPPVVPEPQAPALDSAVVLDTTAQRLAGIVIDSVRLIAGTALSANGVITFDANRVSAVGSRVEGRVATINADLGSEVRSGTVLATIESSEIGEMRGDVERARVRRSVAQRNFEREERLFKQQISSQKEMLEAEGEFRTAEADYNSAVVRLEAVGADVNGKGSSFGLRTPVAGVVVERNATPGQLTGPSSNLFTVADLRHVWITVDVYERDYARIKQRAAVTVTPSALPDDTFEGRVTYSGGVMDPTSRTFKVRVEVENPKHRLRPGMFASVVIATPNNAQGAEMLAVPEAAIQDLNGQPVVFVVGSQPGRFMVRRVLPGKSVGGGLITVTQGLERGDRIVTTGAFQLKSELLKSTFAGDE